MKRLMAPVIAATALLSGAAHAQVDQRNTIGNVGEIQYAGERFGQSFTPTLSGLNYVTVNLNSTSAANNTPMSITIFQGAGFGGTSLGTSNVLTVSGTTNRAYTSPSRTWCR